MSYTLYGSLTSPYVRRIQFQMEGIPYEFKDLNIYDAEGALELNKVNPVNQIPVLTDGEQTIWDSRQIFNYLNKKYCFQNMDWNDENLLTAIEGGLDSAIALLLMKRSGMNTQEPYMYVQRQKDRIESVFDYLKAHYLNTNEANKWNFHSMSLYCYLDWALFRDVIKLDQRPEFADFMNKHSERVIVKQTTIPGSRA